MSHLDEGTLHALLDGELDSAEMRQIEAHLGRCTACGTRLAEVKSVRVEADRLIGSLGDVEAGRGAAPSTASGAAPGTASGTRVAASAVSPPDSWAGPVLLIPEPSDETIDRQKRVRAMGRAAAVLAVVGAGYFAFQLRGPAHVPPATETFSERSRGAPPSANAVLGPEEGIDRPAQTAETAAGGTDEDAAADAEELAAARAESTAAKAAAAEAAADSVRRRQSQAAARDTDRRRELDERTARQLRAAAATADVDRARQASEQAQPAPVSPPPAPPTLEERANVDRRIGLDEAKQQLGSPLHVIEGMSPALVGLVPGRLSPGMDPTRPVVRAVYLDPTNRLIFLDQQRLRTGQSPVVATQLRSVIDGVVVQLHGEPDVVNLLRNLANRIR